MRYFLCPDIPFLAPKKGSKYDMEPRNASEKSSKSVNARENQLSHSGCQLIYPCLAAHQSAWPGYTRQSLIWHFDTRWRQFQKFQLKSPFTMTWALKKKQKKKRKGNNRWVLQQSLPKTGGQAATPWFPPPKIINECVCVCVTSCYGGTEHVSDKRATVFKEKGRPVKLCGFSTSSARWPLMRLGKESSVVCPQNRACLAATATLRTLFKSPTQLSPSSLWPRFPPRCLLC